MAHLEEADEIGDVLFVLSFGVDAVVQEAQGLTNLIEQRRVGYFLGRMGRLRRRSGGLRRYDFCVLFTANVI